MRCCALICLSTCLLGRFQASIVLQIATMQPHSSAGPLLSVCCPSCCPPWRALTLRPTWPCSMRAPAPLTWPWGCRHWRKSWGRGRVSCNSWCAAIGWSTVACIWGSRRAAQLLELHPDPSVPSNPAMMFAYLAAAAPLVNTCTLRICFQ